MAVSYVGAGASYPGTLTLPTGTLAGDLLVWVADMGSPAGYSTYTGFTDPAGWTRLYANTGVQQVILYRYVDGTETAPVNYLGSIAGQIHAFRHVDLKTAPTVIGVSPKGQGYFINTGASATDSMKFITIGSGPGGANLLKNYTLSTGYTKLPDIYNYVDVNGAQRQLTFGHKDLGTATLFTSDGTATYQYESVVELVIPAGYPPVSYPTVSGSITAITGSTTAAALGFEAVAATTLPAVAATASAAEVFASPRHAGVSITPVTAETSVGNLAAEYPTVTANITGVTARASAAVLAPSGGSSGGGEVSMPSFVGFDSGAEFYGTYNPDGITSPRTIGIPSGVQEGDLLILFADTGGGTTVGTAPDRSPPTGWEDLYSPGGSLQVYWKRATASESAPSVYCHTGKMIAIRGAKASGNPFATFATLLAQRQQSGPVLSPQITTAEALTRVVWGLAVQNDGRWNGLYDGGVDSALSGETANQGIAWQGVTYGGDYHGASTIVYHWEKPLAGPSDQRYWQGDWGGPDSYWDGLKLAVLPYSEESAPAIHDDTSLTTVDTTSDIGSVLASGDATAAIETVSAATEVSGLYAAAEIHVQVSLTAVTTTSAVGELAVSSAVKTKCTGVQANATVGRTVAIVNHGTSLGYAGATAVPGALQAYGGAKATINAVSATATIRSVGHVTEGNIVASLDAVTATSEISSLLVRWFYTGALPAVKVNSGISALGIQGTANVKLNALTASSRVGTVRATGRGFPQPVEVAGAVFVGGVAGQGFWVE